MEITIASKFRGPPDCGNGGYVGGLLAAELGSDCANVRFRRPTPLDKPLRVRMTAAGTIQLLDGELLIAEAESATLDVSLPPIPDWKHCVSASESSGFGGGELFDYCFSCGLRCADGLQVRTGGIENKNLVAAAWIPQQKFGDADGHLHERYIWAALDCPGGFALMHTVSDQPYVTGSMSVKINAPINVGEHYRVLGWSEASEGRWQLASTALIDNSGTALAVCRSRWVAVNQ